MSMHRRWLLLAALAATAIALPVPDETDTSSKLLGSSVVTSVSVVMGEEDGKVTDDLPASTVDMLKPDGFQFYTVDEKGQLITRQMTESEIHSIIAAGGGPFPVETQDPQKVGDPASASGEMKVADVVQNVQNVLKGELNKPATAMGAVPTIPGHANDEWSSILPSILGGDSESAPVTLDEPNRNATVASDKPSEEKVDGKRPMIPVPVITPDSLKDPPTTEAKPVYEMLNTISADEVKETDEKVDTPSIELEAPVEEETTEIEKKPETATVIVPSATIIVPEAAISEDEVEPTKKPETLLTELADSVSSMISQVSEAMPSTVPIPQKPDDEEIVKRVEDGVTVKSTTETLELSSPPEKNPEIVMVEIKTTEVPDQKTGVKDEEVPIVRVDITEAKPTGADPENESPGESSVVRIKLNNPTITKIDQMIDSAPAVEVKPISFHDEIIQTDEKVQTPASNLIAGEKLEGQTQPDTLSEKISEPEIVKDDETKSSMAETPEVAKTGEKKPVGMENVEATTDKVESVTQEITESNVKIVADVEKVEEPVKDTSSTSPEVLVDVKPTKAAPEAIGEPVNEEVKPLKHEEENPSTVKTEVKPEVGEDVESKPVEPLKSDDKPEGEKPAEETPKPLKSEEEDKPEAEIPFKETEIEPLKPEEEKPLKNVESEPATPLMSDEKKKPVEGTPSKDVDSEPAMTLESEEKPVDKEVDVEPVTVLKSEEKPVETPLADLESKPVLTVESEVKPAEITPTMMTPLKSDEKLEEKPIKEAEEKPVKETPSKTVETDKVEPLKTQEKPVKETPSKNEDTEKVTPVKSEEKPVKETPSKNVDTEKVMPSKPEEKPVKGIPSENTDTEKVTPAKPEEKPVDKTPSKNSETEPMKPLKSEAKPEEVTPSTNPETEAMKPPKSEEKPVDKTPSKNEDTEKMTPSKPEEKPVDKMPTKNSETEPMKPLKSEEKPEEVTPSETEPIKPLKSEEKPEEETPAQNADTEEIKPLEAEEKPVKETPSKTAETDKMTPLKTQVKPVKEMPSKNEDTEKVTPSKSKEKPVDKTPSKNSETEPMQPLKSEEKPVKETPSKNEDAEKVTPSKSEEKPVDKTPSKNSETEPMQPLKSEEKPVKETPSKNEDAEKVTPLKSEEKPVEEMPSKNSEPEAMKPLKSEEKPVEETPSKNAEPEKMKPLKSQEKPVEEAPPKNSEPEVMKPLKSEEKPVEETLGEDAQIKPTTPLKSEEKPQAENPSKVVESNPTINNTKTVINDEVPVEQATAESTQPDKQADHVPDVSTPALKIPEKIETQTVAAVQDTKVTEVLDVKVETPEVKPEVVPVEETKPEEAPVKVDAQESTVSDQVPIPLVRVDVSPEKNQTVSPATETEAPETDETTKKTEESQDSVVESSNVNFVEPAISESSSKAPETEKIEKSEEPAKTEPTPTVTQVELEEAVKVETKPPAKTQEVRIQVNDTAVLVTQQKVNDGEKKKVDPVSQEQNDKPISQISSDNKKPIIDPFVKLGEKKTSNPNNKWTLIPESESVVKQAIKDSEQPSVSLEAHQSSVNLEESTRDLDKDIGEFAKLCNDLAFSFWIAANKGLSTARSLALSPFGMTSMLAMVFLGARGPTSGQMNDVLKLDDVVTFNPHLVFQNITDSVNLARGQGVANAAFVRELFADRAKAGRILPFYKERAQQFYDGHIEEVNFASISDLVRRRTNLLVRRQTGGRIRDFVKGNVMSLRSPLAALSANVFQTDCTGASSEGRDGEMYFAVLPAVRQRKLVPVPATVWRSGILAGYEPGLDATVVSLGGIGSLVSTIFALPGQQGLAAPGDSLDHLERRLLEGAVVDGVWDRLLKVLIPRMGLEVQVPKFSHRSVVNATAALKRMGLDELFSRHADLKGVNGIGNDLHLADMLQINLFSTCGDEVITGGRHHVEIYPASPFRGAREGIRSVEVIEEAEDTVKTEVDNSRSRRSLEGESTAEEQLIADVGEDRAFRSPLTAASKGKQTDRPLLKLDRPFLYFVRHNPTGMILHMGRFNPRLMP